MGIRSSEKCSTNFCIAEVKTSISVSSAIFNKSAIVGVDLILNYEALTWAFHLPCMILPTISFSACCTGGRSISSASASAACSRTGNSGSSIAFTTERESCSKFYIRDKTAVQCCQSIYRYIECQNSTYLGVAKLTIESHERCNQLTCLKSR